MGRSPCRAAATITGTEKLPMPEPPAPPRPRPAAAGAEGFAASLGVRTHRKYQTPTTMPAMMSTQSHQRLFDGLSACVSVLRWPPCSGRSIELSCPIRTLLTGYEVPTFARASLQKRQGYRG